MKNILHKSFSYFVIFCMIFSSFSFTAYATDGIELDVSNGNVIITDHGYFQGTGTYTEDDLIGGSGNYTLTGSTDTINHILIKSGTINITLKDLTVSTAGMSIGEGDDKTLQFAPAIKVEAGATVNFTLEGNNSLTSKNAEYAAINVEAGAEININGDGTLNAVGGSNAAGIGGNNGENAGTINISGGTITATCGTDSSHGEAGAGIGGGNSSSGGNINITGGIATAIGGERAAGIGGGWTGSGGNINISGAATVVNSYTYVNENIDSFPPGAGIGNGAQCSEGSFDINISDGATVTATGYEACIGGNFENSAEKRDITISGEDTEVNADATLEFVSGYGPGIGGDIKNENEGSNTPLNITISGGTITAKGTCGIGGKKDATVPRNITISGGDVTAEGKAFNEGTGAGIGGGNCENSEILINGNANIVSAKGDRGAGIGGGNNYSGGKITIAGDACIGSSLDEGYCAYGSSGIGGGNGADGGIIEISTTGKVYAYGNSGAGIGGGVDCYSNDVGNGGTINISSGIVHAKGGSLNDKTGASASIGGTASGNGGNITISGGYVDVVNSLESDYTGPAPAFIGGGSNGGSGTILISAGTVDAYVYPTDAPAYDSDANHIGQGEGYSGIDGTVTITGGNVKAGPAEGCDNGCALVRPVPKNEENTELKRVKVYLKRNEEGKYFSKTEITSLSMNKEDNTNLSYSCNDMYYAFSEFGDMNYLNLWLPIGEYTATAIAKMGSTNYNLSGSISVKEELGQRSGELIEQGTFTNSISLNIGTESSLTYNGMDQAPTAIVKDSTEVTLNEGVDYDLVYKKASEVYGDNTYTVVTEIKNAGSYRVYAIGKGQYVGKEDYKSLHINPKHITTSYSGPSFSKQYDGTKDVKNSEGQIIDTLDLTISGGVLDGDSITDVKINSPKYEKSGVGNSINIVSSNITCDGNENHNYSIDDPENLTGDIIKAVAPTVKPIAKALLYNAAHDNVSVNITNSLPNNCGTTNYQLGSITDTNGIFNGPPSINESGNLIFSTNLGEKLQSATIPVTVTMQNYENVEVPVVVTLVDKTEVSITGFQVTNKIYDGNIIAPSGKVNSGAYVGELVYTYTSSDGSGYLSTTPPINAGDYKLVVSIPDSDANYMGSSEDVCFKINKKPLTVKPNSYTIYNGEALPNPTIVYEGLVNSDKGETVAKLASGTLEILIKDASDNKLADSSKNGSYVIQFSGSPVFEEADNYVIFIAEGELNIVRKHSSGGGGGGSSSSSTTIQTKVEKPKTKGKITTATTEIKAAVKNSNARASISEKQVKDTLKVAIDTAKKEKTTPKVEIKVDVPKDAKNVSTTMPIAALKDISKEKADSLLINTPMGRLDISEESMNSIIKQVKTGNITVNAGKVDTSKELNQKQKKVVGDSPVYDLSIMNGRNAISKFEGTITISLPYVLKKGEKPEGINVCHVNSNGNIEPMECVYDSKTKMVSFKTTHFSLYAIAYNEKWKNSFNDINANAWYYESVEFVCEKGLFSGTSKTTFAPNLPVSRGMLVTTLHRLAGKPQGEINKFKDVKAGMWYTDAVNWAANTNIVNGYGKGKFAPNDDVTREQVAVILYHYAKNNGYDVSVSGSLTSFKDSNQISEWAKEPMKWAIGKSLISGKGAGRLEPSNTATRAEVATILKNFVENNEK